MITLHWHTEPLLLVSLLGLAWLYLIATGPLRERFAPGERFPAWQATSWLVGLAVAYLAVGSPLDQLGEDFLFSAHMVQHELLIYVAPPLLLAGLPTWMIDGLLSPRLIRTVWRGLTRPYVGGVLFTLTFTAWHAPGAYEAALQHKVIHVLEHVTIFATALLMWWPFLNHSRRVPAAGYPTRLLTVFLLMVGQLPVFAFLTFSTEVFYPTYLYAPRLEGWLDFEPFRTILAEPLADQIAGGVIMKVCNMAASMILFGYAFLAWGYRSERTDGAGAPANALPRIRQAETVG